MSTFTSYRVLMRIHLPPPTEGHLEAKEIVQFDGTTLKKGDGSVVKLPFSTAITAAINAGWLVPLDSTETEYVPKAAGIEVRAAQSTGEKREVVDVMTVQSEERDLGTRINIRSNADHTQATDRRAAEDARSAKIVSQGAPTGAKTTTLGVVRADGDDGRVVGRFKTSAQSEPIVVGRTDHAVVSKLDNKSTIEVERMGRVVRSATGDVDEAISGEKLTDLLPNAASSKVPAGTFTNDGVEVVSAGSSVGGADSGVVVGRLPSKVANKNAVALEGALRKWSDTGETWDGKPAQLPELSTMARAALTALDEARQEIADLKAAMVVVAPLPEEVGATPESKPVPSSNLEWDVSIHWRSRQKIALDEHGDNIEALRQIVAAEKSKAVISALEARIAELS
jgi:hypothetical protein